MNARAVGAPLSSWFHKGCDQKVIGYGQACENFLIPNFLIPLPVRDCAIPAGQGCPALRQAGMPAATFRKAIALANGAIPDWKWNKLTPK
jgi:hypothetical protein